MKYIKLIITATFFIPIIIVGQTLSNGLQVHYQFDNTLIDSSPFGNDMNVTSGLISYQIVDGLDYAGSFNGSTKLTSSLTFSNSSYSEMAVAIWFKSSTINTTRQVLFQGANSGWDLQLEENTGKIEGFFDASSSGALVSPSSMTDGQWHHVVYQNDGSTTYLYLDGLFVSSQPEIPSFGSGILYLGTTNMGLSPYTGDLNDARIYNRLLTECEIGQLAQIYREDITSYDLDGDLTDASGNGFDQTFIGSSMNYEIFSGTDEAMVFDGSNGTYSSWTNNGFSEQAVSLWVKADVHANRAVLVQGAYCGFAVMVEASTGNMFGFYDGSSSGSATSGLNVCDGTWHHLVTQTNGSVTEIYVDGILANSNVESFNPGTGGSNDELYLAESNLGVDKFTGSMNAIKIYKRTLDSCEIEELSSQGPAVGIEELGKETFEMLHVYPNPSSGVINIESNEKGYIVVYDISGRVIVQQQVVGYADVIDIGNEAEGVYVIVLTTDKSQSMCKVIID